MEVHCTCWLVKAVLSFRLLSFVFDRCFNFLILSRILSFRIHEWKLHHVVLGQYHGADVEVLYAYLCVRDGECLDNGTVLAEYWSVAGSKHPAETIFGFVRST